MQSYASLATQSSHASPAVVSAIHQASAESGVDFSYLMQKAAVESSFNPTAKASTSSASGLYQFIDQTWLTEIAQHGAEFGLGKEATAVSIDGSGHATVADPAMRQEIIALKNDPKAAAEMAAAFTKDNQQSLQQSVGGKIGPTELYLAHFLGAGGAAKFLTALRSNPGSAAADVMPQAADANESVFYKADGTARSLSDVYSRFAAKFSGSGAAVSSSAGTGTSTGAAMPSFTAAGISATVNPGTMGLAADLATDSGAESAFGSTSRASLYEMLILTQLGKLDRTASQS